MIYAVLDTHAWIWFVAGDLKLKKNTRTLISNPKLRFGLCSASLWEANMLGQRKRVSMSPSPEVWIKDVLQEFPLEDIPVDRALCETLATLSFGHNDPIDQFLAAAAYRLKVPLITADSNLLDLPWLKTIEAG